MKKYEFTGETINYEGHILKRIRTTKKFRAIFKGMEGGYIESESNLNPYDMSWVGDEAKVFGKAYVNDYAIVEKNAIVKDNAKISGYAEVTMDSQVFENAVVTGGSIVGYNAIVKGEAIVQGLIGGNAYIAGKTRIYQYTFLYRDAKILSNEDYLYIYPFSITIYRTKNDTIEIKVSQDYLTLKEFEEKAYKEYELKEYKEIIELIKLKFKKYL